MEMAQSGVPRDRGLGFLASLREKWTGHAVQVILALKRAARLLATISLNWLENQQAYPAKGIY
jgi:hypothetical protein